MTDTSDPHTAFSELRRVAVDYAQQASGEIWTDFNLHDPGVTLLEQTCFALSQVAWQAQLPMRDLLTNPRGHFCFHDLALFRPRKVLGTLPVQRRDLQTWFGACPDIDRVVVAPPDMRRPGLYDFVIVPSDFVTASADPVATFRDRYRNARPLCTDLGQVEVAQEIRVVLEGQVEITGETLPETVAAALYHGVSDILSGVRSDDEAARRTDVWEAPERLLAAAHTDGARPEDIREHLNMLRALPGVRDIGALTLRQPVGVQKDTSGAVYYHSVLPRSVGQIRLQLTLNGAAVSLDPARIREEYRRITAEAIAAAVHHVDAPDWDVMRPGRRRSFGQSHVDSLLPGLYRAEGYSMHDPGALISEYREAINGVIRDMIADLDALPRLFTAAPRRQTDDPEAHRLRVELLDYLIALQGAEMPATRHSGVHHYRSVRGRHRFEIAWRLEYLFRLPWLMSARATGPGPEIPGGFLTELAILTDLDLTEDGDQTGVLRDYGITLDDDAPTETPAEDDRIILIGALNPFDMLVPADDGAEPLPAGQLAELSPFLRDGTLTTTAFARMTDPDSLAIAPYPGGSWQVLYDAGDGADLQRCAVIRDKDEAMQTVARLRATWRHLHRACEAAHLTEEILLRGEGPVEVANSADLMLPGWTARCSRQSFRNYVEALVEQLAPAHIHVRVHWLDFAASTRLAECRAGGDRYALRDFVHALPRDGSG
ncbi:hypothetical protein [uncultured Roseobacter sp.]|uniref:hypothetical protein n=1 Tax=uncultured Roseobacter sp. TaxID=114847 RepID=UPI002615D983|nr:hypothetical protein [uncultured Roseobacter sp.]